MRQSSLTFLYLASGATKYESQEVGLKYMADVKKEVVDERAQVRATHGHTRPHTATHGHTWPRCSVSLRAPALVLVTRACGALAPRHPPPAATRRHRTRCHRSRRPAPLLTAAARAAGGRPRQAAGHRLRGTVQGRAVTVTSRSLGSTHATNGANSLVS